MDRVENQRGPAATAQRQILAADQALVEQDPNMIAHGVEGYSALLRQLTCGSSRHLLDGVEQLEPTRLRQPAEVVCAAGHVARVDAGGEPRLPFDRK